MQRVIIRSTCVHTRGQQGAASTSSSGKVSAGKLPPELHTARGCRQESVWLVAGWQLPCQWHSTAALQHCNTAAPQHYCTATPQHNSSRPPTCVSGHPTSPTHTCRQPPDQGLEPKARSIEPAKPSPSSKRPTPKHQYAPVAPQVHPIWHSKPHTKHKQAIHFSVTTVPRRHASAAA